MECISRTTITQVLPSSDTETSLLRPQHSKDKELIHSGFHRLVTNFAHAKSARQSRTHLASRSRTARTSSRSPDIIIEEEMSERNTTRASTVTLTRQYSVDKYTMTESSSKNVMNLEDISKLLTEEETTKFDLQADPRLLKKYGFRKPHGVTKSVCLSGGDNLDEIAEEAEDIEDDAVQMEMSRKSFSESRTLVYGGLYYLALFLVVLFGSICGIIVVTMALWNLVDPSILEFVVKTPPPSYYLKKSIMYAIAWLDSVLGDIYSKIARIFTISVREFFGVQEEAHLPWYQKLF